MYRNVSKCKKMELYSKPFYDPTTKKKVHIYFAVRNWNLK